MGLMIGCPYYQHDKRRTITCEGRLKYFSDKDKKAGHLKNICEKDYKNCKYYQDMQKLYEDCKELSRTEASLKFKSFQLEENRKTVKHLVQQLGITEKNVGHNIAIKQGEIDKLRKELNVSHTKEGVALLELAAVMWAHGINEIDFTDVTKFRETYTAEFETVDADKRRVRLIIKERKTEGQD